MLRAIRYKHPLTLVLVEAVGEDYLNTAGELVHWFNAKGRRTDLRAQLGDGSFVVLLVETDVDGAVKLARRLERAIPRIQTAVSSHPYEGGNFDQLLAAAQSQHGSPEPAA